MSYSTTHILFAFIIRSVVSVILLSGLCFLWTIAFSLCRGTLSLTRMTTTRFHCKTENSISSDQVTFSKGKTFRSIVSRSGQCPLTLLLRKSMLVLMTRWLIPWTGLKLFPRGALGEEGSPCINFRRVYSCIQACISNEMMFKAETGKVRRLAKNINYGEEGKETWLKTGRTSQN